MDADLGSDIALRVEGEHLDCAARPAHVDELVERDPGLVVVRHRHHPGVDPVDARREGERHLAPTVELARSRPIGQFVSLARDAVVLGFVPRHERLPHVVVGLVAMLVVGRIQIGEVERAQHRCQRDGIAAPRRPTAVEEVGPPQREAMVRAGSPLLQVRHLDPGRRVDPIGGFDQAGQQDREMGMTTAGFDRVSDRVDARAVLGPQVTGFLAERAGHVAGLGWQRVERRELGVERVEIQCGCVSGDRALGEHDGVASPIDRRHMSTAVLQLLGDARRAREEVERSIATGCGRDRAEHVHEAALGTQVLDRHAAPTVIRRRRYPAPP